MRQVYLIKVKKSTLRSTYRGIDQEWKQKTWEELSTREPSDSDMTAWAFKDGNMALKAARMANQDMRYKEWKNEQNETFCEVRYSYVEPIELR